MYTYLLAIMIISICILGYVAAYLYFSQSRHNQNLEPISQSTPTPASFNDFDNDESYIELDHTQQILIDYSTLSILTDVTKTKLNGGGLRDTRISGFEIDDSSPARLIEIIPRDGYVYLDGKPVRDKLVFEVTDGFESGGKLEISADTLVPKSGQSQVLRVGSRGRIEKLTPIFPGSSFQVVSVCYRFR